jgi:outer membrane protein TolC
MEADMTQILGARMATIAALACLAVSTVAAGQVSPAVASAPGPQQPLNSSLQLKPPLLPAYENENSAPQRVATTATTKPAKASTEPPTTPGAARRITLEEAELQAGSASNNPLVRLGQLQVEVATQNRLGAFSAFFPQIGSTFENFHFNKFMGQQIEVANRTLGLPLAGQNQTFLTLTATEPITPLFQIHQLYKIAQADETIARAKAGLPPTQTAANVEKNFYGLLVAQRLLTVAEAKAKLSESKWLLANNSSVPVGSIDGDEALMGATKELATATSKVKELAASLDELLGWPDDMQLELVPPEPRFEYIPLAQATEKALAANPEVIEAEQTVVKARAAAKIQKWFYVPTIAVMGGYAYNNNAVPLLPRDFSFIGLVGTYNIFDFGKREHTIKGADAQAEMAELGLELTKAKVAAAVKSSHLELERLQQLSELTRRLASGIELQKASYDENAADMAAARKAKVEAEMFQADLDYRQAIANLKTLIGER